MGFNNQIKTSSGYWFLKLLTKYNFFAPSDKRYAKLKEKETKNQTYNPHNCKDIISLKKKSEII